MPIYALGDITPQIDATAFVHPDAVVIGKVTIGAESTIWPGAVLRGDGAGIIIGARTSIQDGAIVHNTEVLPTTIGDDCTVGHIAHLEGCTVHNAVLIGTASIILHEAVVETGALVGANAVVTTACAFLRERWRWACPPRSARVVPASSRTCTTRRTMCSAASGTGSNSAVWTEDR